MKSYLKKAVCYAAVTGLVVSMAAFVSADGQTASSTLPAQQFDENNVAVKFAAMSDVHVSSTGSKASTKLTSALEQESSKAGGNLDAVLITGDLTDYGKPEQAAALKSVFDGSKVNLKKTKLIAALGNHDLYNGIYGGGEKLGGNLIKNAFGDEAYQGATADEVTAGDYHTTVNGYHFIAVNCAQFEGGVKYADSDLNWLKAQLAAAAADDPSKPIIVASHPSITGTAFGSNDDSASGKSYWNSPTLGTILKDYPQVIYFSGHMHYPENNERSIWQGDYTAVSLGSVYYCSVEALDEYGSRYLDMGSSGNLTQDSDLDSQGMYVEIDKNNNVKLTRMDFANKEDIKSPWIIPAPKADKSHLLYYTPAQEALNKTAPTFDAGATVKITGAAYGALHMQFDTAKDSDLVFCYEISFLDNATGKTIKEISTYSDFYIHAKPSEMASNLKKDIYDADNVLSPFTLKYDKDYYVQVVAVDCFGNKSAPIKSEVYNSGSFTSKPSSSQSSQSSSSASEAPAASSANANSSSSAVSTSEKPSGNPNTGDMAAIISPIALLALSAAGFVLIKKKK